MKYWSLFLSGLAVSLALADCGAGEPTVTSSDLPRYPVVEPKEALGTFRLKPGFHLELAASEPNVASPIAVSFDERGRMFVVEMVDYSERREEVPHLGRIRLLEDSDGDGVYERSGIFAEDLAWPTAVFCYGGGIFVGATPDILYLKDTNGDGKADTREVVFTGFAEGVKRVNVQGMLNSFIWGLDNRIHGATSGNGGVGKSLRHGTSVDLHGRDFAIDPRTMTMTSEAGGGQHGLSFDNYGHRFACNNSDHIRLFLYDDRYAARNTLYSMPPGLASIAMDGPAAEVYRISPEEPWRVIRTKWRVAGLVSGPIEGGGRSAGYFTGATGTTIYRGSAFPPEYLGDAFIGDAGGNLVHRKVLVPDGVGLKAQRGSGEEKREFMASTDTWFRPVQFANAPDGTLYVIDMHREVIEHPWSLPENIKQFLDLNSGNNRGRILRIAPDGLKRPKAPRLDEANIKELVATLAHPNGWHRDTASSLLYERQDGKAAPLLAALLKKSKSPVGRLHALHSLAGLGALREADVLVALDDSDAGVREHAIKLSEKFIANDSVSRAVLAKLEQLVNDPAITVRYQLAFTLGEIKGPGKIEPLAAIARRDAESAWTQAAILSSMPEGAGDMFKALAADASFAISVGGREFLRQLAGLIAAGKRPHEIDEVVGFITGIKDRELSFTLVRALGEGLKRAGSSFAPGEGKLARIVEDAAKAAVDGTSPETTRVQAIHVLGLTSFAKAGGSLFSLLNLQNSQAIQLAALSALGRFNDAAIGEELIKSWPSLTPRLRNEAVTILLARPERANVLLQGIDSSVIQRSMLTTAQIKFLRSHTDRAVKEMAAKVLVESNGSPRQKVVEQFTPALELKGNAQHGRKIYQERCLSCHRLGGEGFALGPDLVTIKNSGKDKLLSNIIDPNQEVRPDYVSYVVATKDDESIIGLVVNETAASVTVRQAYGNESVVSRSNINRMQSQGQSLMPEGLEAGLGPQDMADLIEYLETAQ